MCAKATPSDLLPLRAERGVGDVVLGYAQERLWFLQQLEPASTAYNMPLAARLLRRVDAASVADAIHRLTVRHESLRTVFPLVNGEPKQRVLPDVAIPFVAVDLSARAPGTPWLKRNGYALRKHRRRSISLRARCCAVCW